VLAFLSPHLVRPICRSATEETLRDIFRDHGEIVDLIVMHDRETGRSRGFGFVTYSSEEEAALAIENLNDREIDGRRIKLNLANARPNNNNSGGGYGGGGGRGYSGGGYGE